MIIFVILFRLESILIVVVVVCVFFVVIISLYNLRVDSFKLKLYPSESVAIIKNYHESSHESKEIVVFLLDFFSSFLLFEVVQIVIGAKSMSEAFFL